MEQTVAKNERTPVDFVVEKMVKKAYLGPPRSHADYSSWQSNVLKSENFS